MNKLRHSSALSLLVFLGYLLLTLAFTWPLITRLGTELAGARDDLWIHQWTFWWIKEALLSGQNPFYTTLLYYPNGVSLTSHNIAWFHIALWLPLQALLGAVAAYNLLFILVLTLNGFAFYLFAKAETGAAAAAVLGGLIFGFWPYTLSHYDHPNMMVLFWVPLTMLFILRTFRQGRILDAALAGVCLAMIGISRWQLLVMSAPLLLAYGIYLYFRETALVTRRTAVWVLLSLGLSLLLMAPLAAPVVQDQLRRSDLETVAVEEKDDGVTDLLSYLMPPQLYGTIHGGSPDPLPYSGWIPYHLIAASVNYVPYIGLVTLALALYGLWRQWSKTWFWLLLALGIMITALGPVLVINGRSYPALPMPFRILTGSLLDALIRRPHRLNLFLSLPMAMMATWGAANLLLQIQERWRSGRGPIIAAVTAGLLAALILWENPIPPIPTTATTVPQWYRDLAENEEPFALLEIPFHDRGFDKLYMFYQTTHGKPLLIGHVSRLPLATFDFLESVPFLGPLKTGQPWHIVEESWVDFAHRDITRQFELLAQENVRYIVLNKPLIAGGLIDRWRDWVTFEPAYEDDEVLVYHTRPQAGVDYEIAQQMAGGIGILRAERAPQEANQAGVVKIDVRWASDRAPERDYQVCFYLKDDQGSVVSTTCAQPVAGWPTSEWGPNGVARGRYLIPIDENLPPGPYSIDMALAESGAQEHVGEVIVVGDITITPFAAQHETTLCWENGLCLRGYDLVQSPDELRIDLFWQSATGLNESYKRFVHLVDTRDGRLVAQDDAIPRDWTYPTNAWEPEELVAERLTLPLQDLPAGSYVLRTGWYAADGGESLSACTTEECPEQPPVYHLLTTIDVP
ncbi:MAG: hypothetical protein R3293_16025 [Candidatus Promineifilaceae bacterium]|nr:hypothetical protein [Candidatus Promineifilaceae bacterium]